jgi:putative aminopeptidase FrvX
MSLPTIDQEYFINFLVKLLNIASPTGFAEPAIAFVEKELSQYKQLELSRTRKGALVAKWAVEGDLPPVALTAHVDTLGAVVKEIKSNGRLKLSRIGGLADLITSQSAITDFRSRHALYRSSIFAVGHRS